MAAPAYPGQGQRRRAADPKLRARDERLEALKAVIGKLAHDFNNFLVPQFGYLTLIGEELPPESTAAQYLKTAENAARVTEGYIESILLAGRPQRQYSPKEFDLGSLFAEILEHWAREVSPANPVAITQNIVPAPIQGDERHWRKVFEHLLTNARFALATGGQLSASLTLAELEGPEVERLGIESEAVYRIDLEDSGCGMADEVQEQAFEPFFTTHAQTRGSGLGLTIVHSVTQFHGGQVEIRSAIDEGTRVTLWVPRTPPSFARTAGGGILRPRTGKRPKVLLVEDDPVAKELLRTWLGTLEFDTQIVESPAEAVKLLTRTPANWSLVVAETALQAGRSEGISEHVNKSEGPACIFLAGQDQPSPSGIVLKKPIAFREFSALVQKHARPN